MRAVHDQLRLRAARRDESGALAPRLAVLVVILLLATVAAVAAIQFDVIPTVGENNDGEARPSEVPHSAVPPPTGPGLHLRQPPAAPAVLETVDAAPISIAKLRRYLAGPLGLPGLGDRVGFAVSQLGDHRASWHSGATAVTPASTLKLLTATAALDVLGPAHRFSTAVVRGPGSSIVLVGGGDPLLTVRMPPASQVGDLYPQPDTLRRLAFEAAAALTHQGVRRVRLGYDVSLFAGPSVNPHWPKKYIDQDVVSPISALWVDEGREEPGFARRSTDPAQFAALAFRDQLAAAGIKVEGPVKARSQSPGAPRRLASVTSAPLDQIVEHVLELSDNEGVELLLRHVALATGRPGSSAAGVAAVKETLSRLGLDLRGAQFFDGSGLSRQDLLPIALLLRVLETAASPDHPDLRSVITGLPVAGFSGSLGDRFTGTGNAGAGLGYVRAKTGTLTGVHGLAGLAITRAGQVLVFAAVADEVPVSLTLQARDDLDRIAATLSTCGC